MAIGIDKDCSHGRVYWSDISLKQIFTARYNGSDKRPFITEGTAKQNARIQQKIAKFLK